MDEFNRNVGKPLARSVKKMKRFKEMLKDDQRLSKEWEKLGEVDRAVFSYSIILNPYIPSIPFYKQFQLLTSSQRKIFYGGARGGGKTEAALMGALQFAFCKDWKVGIIRKTYPELSQPNGIMDRCLQWTTRDPEIPRTMRPSWNSQEKRLRFPSGAVIQFGHIQYESDVGRYFGAEFHMIMVDEAQELPETRLIKLEGSNRKRQDDPLPLRVWYTGNPGGVSHNYLKKQFVEGDGLFIPSTYEENPYLDKKAYDRLFDQIKYFDSTLYKRWKLGDWTVQEEGQLLKKEWLREYELTPSRKKELIEKSDRIIQSWDLAISESSRADYTVGTTVAEFRDKIYILDWFRERIDFPSQIEAIKSKAYEYDASIVLVEDVAYQRALPQQLRKEGGIPVKPYKSQGDKVTRIQAALAKTRYIDLYVPTNHKHYGDFMDEYLNFPQYRYDDMLDSLAFAIDSMRRYRAKVYVSNYKRRMRPRIFPISPKNEGVARP